MTMARLERGGRFICRGERCIRNKEGGRQTANRESEAKTELKSSQRSGDPRLLQGGERLLVSGSSGIVTGVTDPGPVGLFLEFCLFRQLSRRFFVFSIPKVTTSI